MKKKTTVTILILITLLGSVIAFYAANLLFSDLSNMFYGIHDNYIVSSVPLFTISVDFVIAFIFVMRYTRYPEYKKATLLLYTLFLAILSLIGVIFAICTGIFVYHSFTAPYPFAGYTLLTLIVNALLFQFAVLANLFIRKQLPADSEKKHFKLKYIIYSIILVILIYFTFNKFGALLYAPLYAQGRTLSLTLPFYVSLLLPLLLLVHISAYFLDAYVGKEKLAVRNTIVIFALNLIFGIAVFVLGYTNSGFIAAVSPALALERLATFPVNTVFQFIAMVLMSAYYLVYAVITLKKSRENA